MIISRGIFLDLKIRQPGIPTGPDINGTEQAELLPGTDLGETIHGFGGNDVVHGLGGNDLIFGDAGHDVLYGEAGADTLNGGDGNDTLIGGTGADKLLGGAGFDTASYATATLGVTVDLENGGVTNDAAGDTYSAIENVTGSAHDDIIAGSFAANVIAGGNGDDFLFALAGNDVIFGGNGNDTMRGGHGNDRLVSGFGQDTMTGDEQGNPGADTFVFGFELFTTGGDVITDFERGRDKLDVSAFLDVAPHLGSLWGTPLLIGAPPPIHITGPIPAELPGTVRDSGLDGTDVFMWDASTSTLYLLNQWFEPVSGQANHWVQPVVTLHGVTELSVDDLILGNPNPVSNVPGDILA